MICPHCKQDAPTIVRDLRAYCTACGAPRSLLSDTPVNVAGQPSRIGGGVASVLGWLTIIGGSLTALAIGALLQLVLPASIAGYIVGGFIGGICLLVGLGLVFGGRKLQQSGNERSRSAREQAVFALARRRGGSVTIAELSQSLSIPEPEADALLTEMAKRPDGRVTLEVDDDGTLRYFVPALVSGQQGRRVDSKSRLRVPSGPRIPDPAEVDAHAEAEADRDEAASRQRTRQ
jgi:hypothetical protein